MPRCSQTDVGCQVSHVTVLSRVWKSLFRPLCPLAPAGGAFGGLAPATFQRGAAGLFPGFVCLFVCLLCFKF